MGEDHKEEQKEKEDDKKNENPPEIVLKVAMHCEACARKVARALKGFEGLPGLNTGVEEVTTDRKAGRVVVKGKASDPFRVRERLQKKSGRKVELISPPSKPREECKQQEDETKGEEPQNQEKKDEPPAPITVVLKVQMHCEACAQVLQKRLRKIQGVETVESDVGSDKVTVKGVINPRSMVDYVYKWTGKHAAILAVKEEKREEPMGKKEDEKKDKGGDEEGKGEHDGGRLDIKKSEYWPPSEYYTEYVYSYPLQIFSDENPNACSLM